MCEDLLLHPQNICCCGACGYSKKHVCTYDFVHFTVWAEETERAMCEVLSLQSCGLGGGVGWDGSGGCIKCMPEVALAT